MMNYFKLICILISLQFINLSTVVASNYIEEGDPIIVCEGFAVNCFGQANGTSWTNLENNNCTVTLCEGEEAALIALPVGFNQGDFDIDWDGGNSTIKPYRIKTSVAGIYTATITNNATGCTIEKSITLSYQNPIQVNCFGQVNGTSWTNLENDDCTVTLCEGEEAALIALPVGFNQGDFTIDWDGGTPTIKPYRRETTEAGVYTATITNNATGCTTVKSITLLYETCCDPNQINTDFEINAFLQVSPNGICGIDTDIVGGVIYDFCDENCCESGIEEITYRYSYYINGNFEIAFIRNSTIGVCESAGSSYNNGNIQLCNENVVAGDIIEVKVEILSIVSECIILPNVVEVISDPIVITDTDIAACCGDSQINDNFQVDVSISDIGGCTIATDIIAGTLYDFCDENYCPNGIEKVDIQYSYFANGILYDTRVRMIEESESFLSDHCRNSGYVYGVPFPLCSGTVNVGDIIEVKVEIISITSDCIILPNTLEVTSEPIVVTAEDYTACCNSNGAIGFSFVGSHETIIKQKVANKGMQYLTNEGGYYILKEEITSNYDELSIHPNPFKDQITLTLDSPINEVFELNIYNTNGQLIKTEKGNLQKGLNNICIKELGDLNVGVYFYQFISVGNSTSGKILKR